MFVDDRRVYRLVVCASRGIYKQLSPINLDIVK